MNETSISNTAISNNDNDYQFSTSEPQAENISTPTSTTVIDNKDISNSENLNVSISDPVSNEKIRMDLSTNRASLQNTSTNTTIKHTEVIKKTDHNTHVPNNQHQITNAVPGYNGPYGCNHPMTSQMFAEVKTSISSKSFENSKLTIAKQVISNNCLTSAQVKEILKLFDFEATKLDVAKFAYGYTYDKGNYYQLNDAFNFESSIDELNNYIKTKN